MTCTKQEAFEMIKEIADIVRCSHTSNWSKEERREKSKRLEEIRKELLKFRRENPNA